LEALQHVHAFASFPRLIFMESAASL
jgi:hypothetical protein